MAHVRLFIENGRPSRALVTEVDVRDGENHYDLIDAVDSWLSGRAQVLIASAPHTIQVIQHG